MRISTLRKLPLLLFLPIALCVSHALPAPDAGIPVLGDAWVSKDQPNTGFASGNILELKKGQSVGYLIFNIKTPPLINQEIILHLYTVTGSQPIHVYDTDGQLNGQLNYNNRPILGKRRGSTVAQARTWTEVKVDHSLRTAGRHIIGLLTDSENALTVATQESGYGAWIEYRDAAPVDKQAKRKKALSVERQEDAYYVLADTPRQVSSPGVLGNDRTSLQGTLRASLEREAQHGEIQLLADGSFRYTPRAQHPGTDTFTYRNFNDGESSEPITVLLQIVPESIGTFPVDELKKIHADLGITLNIDEQLDLAQVINPLNTEPWRDQANARIDSHRKANMRVSIRNQQGEPISNAKVDLRLIRKSFLFSGAVRIKDLVDGIKEGIDATSYRALVKTFFDSVGVCNGLKPRLRRGNEAYLPKYFEWCETNDIPSRGHLLLWPGNKTKNHMTEPVLAATEALEAAIAANSPEVEALKDTLKDVVKSEIKEWASKWPVYEWDVINEPLGNHRLQDLLGADQMAEWFRIAKANVVYPDCKLVVNDYQIISAMSEQLTPGQYTKRRDEFMANIEQILNDEGPLDRIGFQSRIKFEHRSPSLIYERLEEFSDRFGLEMVGTEFEIIDLETWKTYIFSEHERAQITEEMMTVYFSHPHVAALTSWSFLNDQASALITSHGDIKLNGLVWYYLHRIRYHTEEQHVTDNTGSIDLRAFKGDYMLTIHTSNGPKEHPLSLSGDNSFEISLP